MKIILASQSPRRVFLLEQMGLSFETIPSNFEEYFDDKRSVFEVVSELGLNKALIVAQDYPDAIVIGGDIIVVLDGMQIGKPESIEDAKRRLRSLSNRSHQLVCSVAVVCIKNNYRKVLTDSSEVTFDELSDDFINLYVETGTTLDKAGGYAIQHPMMRPHIKKINGRLDSIIGLPTNLLAQLLRDFDINVASVDIDWNSSEIAKVLFE